MALYNSLGQEALDGVPLGSDLERSELQYSDGVALVAAYTAIASYEDGADVGPLWSAMLLLEKMTQHSASNPQLRLCLVRLHQLLGNVQRMFHHWQQLEVKQIQMDSISYILCDHAARLGGLAQVASIYSQTTAFFKEARATGGEYVCQAYTYGNYGKVEDIARLTQRLKNSMQWAWTRCEQAHWALLHKCRVRRPCCSFLLRF
jgi:N-terminal acetyltransferase B complex non-catalytic subunit